MDEPTKTRTNGPADSSAEEPGSSSGEEPEGPTLRELIGRVVSGEDLTTAEAERAFREVMSGRASPVQVAALLAALHTKGEAPTEVAGGVRAMRAAMVPVASGAGDVVDTCGTGGGALVTFNISTAAALLAAAAGVAIAKHGNRSFSSRCGSADVLESLGVRIDLSPEAMGAVLDETGIVFMFAPLLHPAMRHVGPVRGELGISTIFNLLGPLTNPAGASRQVVGVADPALLDLVAGGLGELGHEHALVVHGRPGLDELSPVGVTDVVEVRVGKLRRMTIAPEDFGWQDLDPAGLAGGDPAHNAAIVRDVLGGAGAAAARAAVVLNAGAALYVAGRVESLVGGVEQAESVLDSGAARQKLNQLIEASNRLA